MSKSGHKTPDFLSDVTSEDSTPHYARSTTESRNKRKKVQKNRISPSRSPRFCEDSDLPQVTCRNLEIKVSVYDHEPNLFTRSQSSNNARGVFNERLESEINFYKRKLSERDLEMERLRCKIENDKEVYKKHLFSKHKEIEIMKSNLNNDHRDCKKRLSVKDKEIEKLKGIIKELEIQVKQNREEHDDLKRKRIEYENKLQEYLEVISTSRDEKSRLTSELQKKFTENKKMRETSMEQQDKIREHETTLEKMSMIIEKYKGLNNSIMESNVEKEDRNRDLEINLNHVEMMKEDLSRRFEEVSKDLQASEKDNKLLRIEFEKNCKRIKQLKEKECGINDLQMQLDAKMEENNRLTQHISRSEEDIKDIQASKRLADEKLQGLQTENASLKSALSKATNEINDLNKGTNLQKYKTDAEHKASKLMNALREKDTENEALKEQLARAEENVSVLSQDIKDIQASNRQVDKEKLQRLQTENASLKSDLSKATNEIEDLMNKDTNLQKYKTDAEHKTNTLMNALREEDTENEALREQLARAENRVSILSKDIKDMQASKRQVAEEKLQSLQTENTSLKSALSKATNEIEDLVNKGTNLQKYKTDAEHKTSMLMNALREKNTENEALKEQLARSEENVSILLKDIKNIQESKRLVAYEKLQDLKTENDSLKLTLAEATSKSEENVSILSKDIKDVQGSKRQADDEKVQSLQTENASIKLELAKATTEIDAFRNKCTDLQKYKTDTEHTNNTLLNAVKEKETEFETLNKQLASYDQKGRDSKEAKRERNHNLKRFNSGAEEDGDSNPEHTGLM